MAFFMLGLVGQPGQPVRLRAGRGRGAAGQDQRRAVRLGQGDGRLGRHPPGPAGDEDHVLRAQMDRLPGSARRTVRASSRVHRWVAAMPDLDRAGGEHLVHHRGGRPAGSAAANAGARSIALQATSGHSCRAVLTSPASPPAVGSASGREVGQPERPVEPGHGGERPPPRAGRPGRSFGPAALEPPNAEPVQAATSGPGCGRGERGPARPGRPAGPARVRGRPTPSARALNPAAAELGGHRVRSAGRRPPTTQISPRPASGTRAAGRAGPGPPPGGCSGRPGPAPTGATGWRSVSAGAARRGGRGGAGRGRRPGAGRAVCGGRRRTPGSRLGPSVGPGPGPPVVGAESASAAGPRSADRVTTGTWLGRRPGARRRGSRPRPGGCGGCRGARASPPGRPGSRSWRADRISTRLIESTPRSASRAIPGPASPPGTPSSPPPPPAAPRVDRPRPPAPGGASDRAGRSSSGPADGHGADRCAGPRARPRAGRGRPRRRRGSRPRPGGCGGCPRCSGFTTGASGSRSWRADRISTRLIESTPRSASRAIPGPALHRVPRLLRHHLQQHRRDAGRDAEAGAGGGTTGWTGTSARPAAGRTAAAGAGGAAATGGGAGPGRGRWRNRRRRSERSGRAGRRGRRHAAGSPRRRKQQRLLLVDQGEQGPLGRLLGVEELPVQLRPSAPASAGGRSRLCCVICRAGASAFGSRRGRGSGIGDLGGPGGRASRVAPHGWRVVVAGPAAAAARAGRGRDVVRPADRDGVGPAGRPAARAGTGSPASHAASRTGCPRGGQPGQGVPKSSTPGPLAPRRVQGERLGVRHSGRPPGWRPPAGSAPPRGRPPGTSAPRPRPSPGPVHERHRPRQLVAEQVPGGGRVGRVLGGRGVGEHRHRPGRERRRRPGRPGTGRRRRPPAGCGTPPRPAAGPPAALRAGERRRGPLDLRRRPGQHRLLRGVLVGHHHVEPVRARRPPRSSGRGANTASIAAGVAAGRGLGHQLAAEPGQGEQVGRREPAGRGQGHQFPVAVPGERGRRPARTGRAAPAAPRS